MVHDDQQPLGHDLAVGTPELGHVGVHRQLLARQEQVGVDDGRLDHGPAVQALGRRPQARVVAERLDAGCEHIVAVGVRLAEVVGARRPPTGRLVGAAEPAAGAHEVHRRFVALRQFGSEAGVESLVGVLAVGAEVMPERDQLRRPGVVEKGVEDVDHTDILLASRSRCGTTTYFGSAADWTPALKTA